MTDTLEVGHSADCAVDGKPPNKVCTCGAEARARAAVEAERATERAAEESRYGDALARIVTVERERDQARREREIIRRERLVETESLRAVIARLQRELADTREAYLNQSARLLKAESADPGHQADELERCQRALLQVRKALGLHRDSSDDLLVVIAKLRAVQPQDAVLVNQIRRTAFYEGAFQVSDYNKLEVIKLTAGERDDHQ